MHVNSQGEFLPWLLRASCVSSSVLLILPVLFLTEEHWWEILYFFLWEKTIERNWLHPNLCVNTKRTRYPSFVVLKYTVIIFEKQNVTVGEVHWFRHTATAERIVGCDNLIKQKWNENNICQIKPCRHAATIFMPNVLVWTCSCML